MLTQAKMSPTTITDKEKTALSEFRNKLSDLSLSGEKNTDLFLIRWIRARDMDLVQAEAMLRKNLIWREEHDMDNILKWVPPVNLSDELPFEIFGHDKDGCPILVIPFGLYDVKKAVDLGQKEDYLRFIDAIFEKVIDCMRNATGPEGEPITQFVLIYDMINLNFRQLTSVGAVDAMLETIRRYEANYPETLKTCVVINSSRVFVFLYGLVKPFLSQKTANKVQIYASNASKWKSVLLKNIDADQLPEYFGGTSCHTLKWQVTEKTVVQPNDSPEEDFISVTVPAGETRKINNYIKHPNSIMSWNFRTDSNDIGFSVQDENNEEIVPYKRVDSHISKQSGSVTCMKAGSYVLSFDNTFSRMRSKVLHYNVSISSPDCPDEDDDSDEVTRL